MSTEAEQASAAILRRPKTGVPLGAAKNDVGNAGQRLRIINDRRSAPEPDHSRERWPDSRDAALAFERLHQRRFLPNFVRAGAAMPINIEIVAAAKDILAEKAARIRVAQGFLHDDRQVAILAADVDVSDMGLHCEGGNHHALDYGVRIVFEDQPVFAGPGFALVAVAQNVFGLRRLLGNERPLHSGVETRATPAAKPRILYLINNRVRTHAQRFLNGLVAVERQ